MEPRRSSSFLALLLIMAFALGTSAFSQATDVIRIAISAEIESMDATKNASGLAGDFPKLPALEGLTALAPDGSLEPLLATEWSVSDDGLTWTFSLREGVLFHDGLPFDSNTVVANVDRWLDPNVLFQRLRHMPALAGAEAVDDYTVVLTTSSPFPILPRILADGGAVMHHPMEIESYGEELGTQLPSGTGAYRIVEYAPRQRVVLERWDQYWGSPAATQRIEIVSVPDATASLAMLQTGQVDVSLYVPMPLRSAIEADPNLMVVAVPSSRLYTLHMNHAKEPFQDIRVRQALNLAVDREAIVDSIFGGHALVARSMLSEGVTGFVPVFDAVHDLERARDLMADAGWVRGPDGVLTRNGERFSVELVATTGAYPMDADLAQAVGEYYRQLGLNVSIRTPGVYSVVRDQTIANPDARQENDLVQYAFGAAHGDPSSMVNTYATSQISPAGINSSFYSDSEYDELVDLQAREFDEGRRNEILADIQRHIVDDAVVVLLVQPAFLVGMHEEITGFSGNAMEYHRITQLRWSGN